MKEELNRFKEIFWDAFHKPSLKTDTFYQAWERLEKINDYLVGPLFSIYENDHCDYFFEDKERFPFMNSADDLLSWCTILTEDYKTEIEKIEAQTDDEISDKKTLLYQVDIKMELSDLAYNIQGARINII